MDPTRDERFVELGRSPVPMSQRGSLGSHPHPYVVQISLSGPRGYLAISTGSGHLGSGRVLPLADAFLDTGELDPVWREEFDGAGVSWALPLLREAAGGAPVTEADVVDAYRRRHGVDPTFEVLPVR